MPLLWSAPARRLGRVFAFAASAALGVAAIASVAHLAHGDERAATAARLDELERDPAHKDVTAESVRGAREAMERATRLRSAGDETHAKLADGLARELSDSAFDLARAVDVERQAQIARRDAIDAGAHAERERALLEEGIARNGRLRAQLEAIDRTRKEAPLKTNAAGAVADGGTPSKATKGPAEKGGGEIAPTRVDGGVE